MTQQNESTKSYTMVKVLRFIFYAAACLFSLMAFASFPDDQSFMLIGGVLSSLTLAEILNLLRDIASNTHKMASNISSPEDDFKTNTNVLD